MSVIWSGVTESGAVVPVQVDGVGRVIATTGEPPGPPVINYNGASAWVNFDGRGSNGKIDPRGAMNVARITKVTTGTYQVQFTNPLGSADYSVVCGSTSFASELTPAGFLLSTFSAVDASPFDLIWTSFAVHSINALPPMGGTGTDAWANFDCNPAKLRASFNIASVTRTGVGSYDFVFTTPMPTSDYAVVVGNNTAGAYVQQARFKTVSGFTVKNFTSTAPITATDAAELSFTVNSTNATLPITYTREQLDAVINNWQKTGDTLSTKDAVEMNGPVRLAGGKAGFTDEGQLYFTPGPGPQKYLVGVEEGQMKLSRIDSAY